ncbi:hypothetical protein [Rhizohabitans arisaemae]|uniref:hypothetical protein n=1 Tax=Rhizohabitans arisaemae TaxID=2720610 RepID=UPI0024B1DE99|nr:hypothetical protein [Rhizohabitans arisaemae]
MLFLEIFGVLVAIQGFGSAASELFGKGRSWGLMGIAEDFQPFSGILIGLLGVLLIVAGEKGRRANRAKRQ